MCAAPRAARYVAVHAHWHVQSAMDWGRPAASQSTLGAAETQLVHQLVAADQGLAAECALGVGTERMLGLVDAAERNGQWMVAARLLVAESLLAWNGRRPHDQETPLLRKAMGYLKSHMDGDADAAALEATLLARVMMHGALIVGDAERLNHLRQRKSANAPRTVASSALGDMTPPRSAKEVLQEAVTVLFGAYAAWRIMGAGLNSPEDRFTIPTAEEIAAGDKVIIAAFQMLRDWVPEWRRLDDPDERIVGGVCLYGQVAATAFNTTPSLARWCWDEAMLDEMGGLAAWQRTWGGYDFHRHHALAIELAMDTFDYFLCGSGVLPWLMGGVRAES